MGMLHLITRRPHASRKYVKYAVTGCLLPPLFPSPVSLFFVSSQFSLISLSSLSCFNSRKKGGRTGLFSRVYHVTCIYIYIYRLIDILTHQAIRSFTFYFYFINKHRSTMRSRDSWGKGTSVVVCSEKYPFRTKLVVLLSVCTSSVCMTVSMPRKIWIMIFRRGLREEGGIRLNFEKRVIIFFNYRPHLFHLVVALHAYCDIHR